MFKCINFLLSRQSRICVEYPTLQRAPPFLTSTST